MGEAREGPTRLLAPISTRLLWFGRKMVEAPLKLIPANEHRSGDDWSPDDFDVVLVDRSLLIVSSGGTNQGHSF